MTIKSVSPRQALNKLRKIVDTIKDINAGLDEYDGDQHVSSIPYKLLDAAANAVEKAADNIEGVLG